MSCIIKLFSCPCNKQNTVHSETSIQSPEKKGNMAGRSITIKVEAPKFERIEFKAVNRTLTTIKEEDRAFTPNTIFDPSKRYEINSRRAGILAAKKANTTPPSISLVPAPVRITPSSHVQSSSSVSSTFSRAELRSPPISPPSSISSTTSSSSAFSRVELRSPPISPPLIQSSSISPRPNQIGLRSFPSPSSIPRSGISPHHNSSSSSTRNFDRGDKTTKSRDEHITGHRIDKSNFNVDHSQTESSGKLRKKSDRREGNCYGHHVRDASFALATHREGRSSSSSSTSTRSSSSTSLSSPTSPTRSSSTATGYPRSYAGAGYSSAGVGSSSSGVKLEGISFTRSRN